ncbi:hypothetical protein DBA29_21980 [Xenophilus aerolatus]|nr:hypothetical protein [Xenophilus aerolatus]
MLTLDGNDDDEQYCCTIMIVIVCRNARTLLERTLSDIQALGDPRVQIIVIDGDSSDGTFMVLDCWRDALFHCASEPDKGIYDAMNKGWQAAPENSYILFLGAGDRVLSLPTTADMIDNRGRPIPVIIGDCMVGNKLFVSRWDSGMRFRNTAHHQSLLIHKSSYRYPPFDETLKIFADWDFNLRLLHAGMRAKRVERFRSFAEPDGVSARPDLDEVRRVAQRHGGAWAGWVAWARYRAFLAWRRVHR